MDVNGIALNYSASLTKNKQTNVHHSENNDCKFQNILSREKDTNSYGISDIWKELSDNFNVRNASFEEICEISFQLYQSGKISLGEHAILTFDWNKARAHMQQHLNIPVVDLHLTPANFEGKRNWIAEYEARMNRDLQLNNLLGYEINKKITGILKRLEKQ